MRRVTLVAFLATFAAISALAMTAEIDTDGDGRASLAELQIAYPEVTDALFQEIDTDGDGFVNDEEMLIAIELGTLSDPASKA